MDNKILSDKEYDMSYSEMNSYINFLLGLTEKVIDAVHTVDNHANVMIGINTGIFVLVVSKLFESDVLRLTLGVVAIFSAISGLLAVFATRVPRFFIKRKYDKSILHAKQIAKFESATKYSDELQKITQTKDELFRQHSLEAYNLSKYYYVPKRRILTLSRYVFILGVMTSGMFLLLEKIHWFVR